jgi:hypothetical protein
MGFRRGFGCILRISKSSVSESSQNTAEWLFDKGYAGFNLQRSLVTKVWHANFNIEIISIKKLLTYRRKARESKIQSIFEKSNQQILVKEEMAPLRCFIRADPLFANANRKIELSTCTVTPITN